MQPIQHINITWIKFNEDHLNPDYWDDYLDDFEVSEIEEDIVPEVDTTPELSISEEIHEEKA